MLGETSVAATDNTRAEIATVTTICSRRLISFATSLRLGGLPAPNVELEDSGIPHGETGTPGPVVMSFLSSTALYWFVNINY